MIRSAAVLGGALVMVSVEGLVAHGYDKSCEDAEGDDNFCEVRHWEELCFIPSRFATRIFSWGEISRWEVWGSWR